jgi:NAD(P)H-hydrate repair Nnr-like enzyme with NAD(P)H-hydrate epimerase domain
MHALSRTEVREVDRLAIEEYGLPGIVLMENAGASAFTGTVHVLDIGAPAALLARFGVGR